MSEAEGVPSVEEFRVLADAQFAEEWRLRYMLRKSNFLPDIARWMRILRYVHPRTLSDHWQDTNGNPLPKLFESEGLSVEIFNWCFVPGTPVVVPEGTRPIESLGIGQPVLGHDGAWHPVDRALVRNVSEDLVRVSTFGSPAYTVTKEHPFLTTRGWVPAGELSTADRVLGPITKADGADIDEDLARLLGWYVSEGSATETNWRVAFSFHPSETSYRAEVEDLLRRRYGKTHITHVEANGCVQVVAYSKEIATELIALGGKHADGKRLAPHVLASPQSSLVYDTAYLGDGTRSRTRYTTNSLALLNQFQQVLLRRGIAPSVGERLARPGHAASYTLSGASRYDRADSGVISGDQVSYPIRSIDRVPYTGPVYDIEVRDAHSFTLPGAVSVHNCRPIIEVYGSLLAGQKPMPFMFDIPPIDVTSNSEVVRADGVEKLLFEEMYQQKIPLHFLDFCVSTVMFGIGYAYSWIDEDDRRLRTQAISWPGDVLPEWGSDRYGRSGRHGPGEQALENCIIQERVSFDTAKRLYPNHDWQGSAPDYTMRPDGNTLFNNPTKSVQILKIWYRWTDTEAPKSQQAKIGYSEISFDGMPDGGESFVLYREDDTKYPDIPIVWATRFQTPGEPPHRGAGVLDDIVGLNTEYDEKLSALADALMKAVYTKYKGKGMTPGTVPRLPKGSNIFPLGPNQDLEILMEQIQAQGFDSFLGRLETMMMTVSGLSHLMMGSLPPGETSGEALSNLLHAAVARLEVIRTPIQWAWISLIMDIWVPLLSEFGVYTFKDSLSKKITKVKLADLLVGINRMNWMWPDVTPRDALHTVQSAVELGRSGYLSDESVMARISVPSVVDEIAKIRRQKQDVIMHPNDVRDTASAQATQAATQQQLVPAGYAPFNATDAAGGAMPGAGISRQIVNAGFEAPDVKQATLPSVAPPQQPPTAGPQPAARALLDRINKQHAAVRDQSIKAEAAKTPTKTPSQNKRPFIKRAVGSLQNAAQGRNANKE